MKYWLKAWQSQAKLHIDIEENVAVVLCVGADTIKPPATHQISRETGLSQSPIVHIIYRDLGLKCLKRHHEKQLSEANHHAFITPDLWSLNSQYLNPVNYICGILQQRVTRQDAGCERFEAASDWRCGLEWTMPLHNHWCRRIHACIRARTGHFFIFTVTQITQKVVNCNNCSA